MNSNESIEQERNSIANILAEARQSLLRVTPEMLSGERENGTLIVDIRPVEQRQRDGDLPGAIVIDRNVLEWRLDPSSEHRIPQVTGYDIRIVIVCNEGVQLESRRCRASKTRTAPSCRHDRWLPSMARH